MVGGSVFFQEELMLNFNAVIFNIAALQAKFIKPYLSNIRD